MWVCKHPRENFTQPLQLNTAEKDRKNKLNTFIEHESITLVKLEYEKTITPYFVFEWVTWDFVGFLTVPATPSAPLFSQTNWQRHSDWALLPHPSVCLIYVGMLPFRELYERSEHALEASLFASSSEHIPEVSYRRRAGFFCLIKQKIHPNLHFRYKVNTETKKRENFNLTIITQRDRQKARQTNLAPHIS